MPRGVVPLAADPGQNEGRRGSDRRRRRCRRRGQPAMTTPQRPGDVRRDDTGPGTQQWRVESLQVVNWGGFDGHHTVDFAESATLLSGASGTGKSTLLDAYIALMMESNTPFNGASNDNVTGRARSSEQRNILSYVRGKVDTSREAGTG